MHVETDKELRSEADQLIGCGLRSILDDYGEVHVIGSYALPLMAWRDLDIHMLFSSSDIYSAVLDHGVVDIDGFWTFLKQRNYAV